MTPSNADPCWLRFTPLEAGPAREELAALARRISVVGRGPVMETARAEVLLGLQSLLGGAATTDGVPRAGRAAPTLLIATAEAARASLPEQEATEVSRLPDGGFLLQRVTVGGGSTLLVCGGSPAAALHGVFRLLTRAALGEPLPVQPLREEPPNPLRMLCHWDNMDGSVERGYAGASIFFRQGRIVRDLTRVREYARLLASVGVNAVCVNNVNVHAAESRLVGPGGREEAARLAEVFRAWGIRLFLSVNFAAPLTDGGLPTADPLDPGVRRWWSRCAADLYRSIPDFGGFMVKADSEGRPGPFTYGRSHADGANMLADALSPHNGVVLWRCFVYNSQQDWRDRRTDRARAAFDSFTPLDGKLADNVVLLVKNGPVDFQVREPVSPLFGAMARTNLALELQVTQEYTGQQRHLCCLVPQWKEYLDFDTAAAGQPGTGTAAPLPATVGRVASGRSFGRPRGGMVGVSNIGGDPSWTGHVLAQANLYGFCRLASDPTLPGPGIIDEWTKLTLGRDPELSVVSTLLRESWRVYESYTAPLGVGWMVNPGHHYGPNVDGYEYSRWGTYHLADSRGVGVDRSSATGTGFAAQYRPANAARYETAAACPDELLLFFHHVPYTHALHSGKTVIQHIYDSHFEGAEAAAAQVETWRALRARIDPKRFTSVLARLEEQAAHAREWRDVVNAYFWRKSGIPDARGRPLY